MAKFQITSPEGENFEIEAPDDATDEQVLSYAQSNWQPKAAAAQPASPTSYYPPSAQGYMQELGQGATFGLNDEIGSGLAAIYRGMQKGTINDFSKDYAAGLEGVREQQRQLEQQDPAGAFGAQLVGGLATGGAFGGTKAAASIANSLRAGKLGKAAVQGATTGAASGGVYGFGTGEGNLDQRLDSARTGAVYGGVTGGALPVAANAIGGAAKAVGNIAAPQLEEATAQLAKRAQDFGIPLRLDQIDPSRVRQTVQKVSQELPFSGVNSFDKKQVGAFNKAVAKTIGQDSDNLSPNTIQAFRTDNSAKFNDAFKGQNFNFTNMDKNDLMNIAEEAKGTIDAGLSKVVRDNVEKTLQQLKSGKITGEQLSSVRSELLKRMTRMKNSAAPYVGDIIEKLDDIASAQMHPDKLQMLGEARRQYRNFKTIQPLLEKSTDGNINPTQLINRIGASKYIDASKIPTGQDDLVDLARIGKQFMPELGGSDTIQKGMLIGGAGSVGALGATAITNPIGALGGAALGAGALGANRLFQKGMNQSQKNVTKSINKSLQPYSSIKDKNIPRITIPGNRP